jgi:hypothetical protein
MHTYRKTPQGDGNYLYTVGFELADPNVSNWRPIKDFKYESAAAAFCSYLNGGERFEYSGMEITAKGEGKS